MVEITLTKNEAIIGSTVGMRRRVESVFGGYSRKKSNEENRWWDYDIEGACAELAVAKALGVYWNFSVNTCLAPDVGVIQVRHTVLPKGSLILRPEDNDDEAFYLVTGITPRFNIIGWVYARNGKVDKYLDKTPPPYWKVPQDCLCPITKVADDGW